jgi:hypothetical protein
MNRHERRALRSLQRKGLICQKRTVLNFANSFTSNLPGLTFESNWANRFTSHWQMFQDSKGDKPQ